MATVHHGQSHGDPHDDDSLLGDDLIEADDGEYLFVAFRFSKGCSRFLILCYSSHRR
jgi:hypothetical protein